MTKIIAYGTIIFATLVGLLIGFSVVIVLDSYTSKNRKRTFAAIIALTVVLIMQNYFSCYLTLYVKAITWRVLVSVIGYAIRPVIITLFAVLFAPDKKHVIAWCLVGANAVMHATAFFSKIVFSFDSQNRYHGGPLRYLCYIICAILLVYLAFLGFSSYKKKKADWKEVFFHLFWILIIVLGIVCDFVWADGSLWISYVTVAVVIAEVFSYIWLHQRFVEDYESAVLAEQRYKTMISQLRPHFIYNSLSAIAEIEGVPEKAQEAIVDLSRYLRDNLDAMTLHELIPFKRELEHIKKYVELEKLRFGDRVNVVFDIQSSDFLLPAMVVQMLVENAIKHGITKKYEGGTVWVSTKYEDKKYVVTVRDDGVGFDTEKEISGNHIGINNIRKRIEYSIDGTLDIASEIGKGTTATVVIPEGKKEKNNEDLDR